MKYRMGLRCKHETTIGTRPQPCKRCIDMRLLPARVHAALVLHPLHNHTPQLPCLTSATPAASVAPTPTAPSAFSTTAGSNGERAENVGARAATLATGAHMCRAAPVPSRLPPYAAPLLALLVV